MLPLHETLSVDFLKRFQALPCSGLPQVSVLHIEACELPRTAFIKPGERPMLQSFCVSHGLPGKTNPENMHWRCRLAVTHRGPQQIKEIEEVRRSHDLYSFSRSFKEETTAAPRRQEASLTSIISSSCVYSVGIFRIMTSADTTLC